MIPHRLRQFAEAGASPRARDLDLAREWLDGAAATLFLRQHPRDVVHAANTARWLLDRGHREPDLVRAALLHDIGKGEQRRTDRAVWVLVSSLGAGQQAGSVQSRFALRRALARSRDHSQAGAEALRQARASARVVELTALHHSSAAGDPVLALLQTADAAN